MQWTLIVFVLALGCIVVCLKLVAKGRTFAWPMKATSVLTRPEQVLYWRLLEALPDRVILAQVQLSRMLKIDTAANRRTWLNRIDRKSADFVVCSKDLQPQAVIELDDTSHAAPARRKADADKDAALGAAQIRVLRFNVRRMPTVDEIKIAIAGEALPVGVAAPAAAVVDTGLTEVRQDARLAVRASRSRRG